MGKDSTTRDEKGKGDQLGLFGDVERGESPRSPAPRGPDEIAAAVLDHLNEITERTGPARFTSPTAIRERLRDGAKLEDLLLVIDFCYAMWWGDRKMETYIRPKTLFSKENFPEYLVRGRKWHRDGRPSLLGAEGKIGAGEGGYARGADYYAKRVEQGGGS